jgi:hypothetical protein
MDTALFILKALIILCVNIGFGFLISYCFHFYLFHPRKVYIGKYHLPLTPGLTYRKKQKLLDYLKNLIDDYFRFARQDPRVRNFLSDYEHKIYHEVFPLIYDFCDRDWIPEFFEDKVRELASQGTWFIIRKFSRSILPKMLDEWQIYTKLDLLDLKLDIKMLEDYFDEYFYKWFKLFNMVFLGIVGILNMVMFLILA